ncbi:MAG: hypothetical protein WC859_10310 [Elusimicrobiota bacterium]|jgi:hypothetical protein
MKSRKAFLIAIAAALLFGTTIAQAQSPISQGKPDTRTVECHACGYVKQVTDRSNTTDDGSWFAVLKAKITGKPQTVGLVLVPQKRISAELLEHPWPLVGAASLFPQVLDQMNLSVRSPKIPLHVGDLVAIDRNSDVLLIEKSSAP